MSRLNKKIPPIVVVFVSGLIVWGVSKLPLTVHVAPRFLFGLAVFILMVGLAFIALGIRCFYRAKTTVNPASPEQASVLVSSGVYAVTRNPMYLGFAFILMALSVYLASPLSIMGVVGFMAYLTRFQILPEEQALTEVFGKDYSNYKAHVRRWL